MVGNAGILAAIAANKGKFDAAKHSRGTGGKFSSMGGGAKKPSGAVATAHGIFDKLKGKPKSELLAAAQAAGINANTAKTQLYHWQKKQAAAALGNNASPTKEELQAAAAKALGVKQAAAAPKPKPALVVPPKSSAKPSADEVAAKYHAIADGPGTAEQKQDKLTKKLFDDMDAVGPTDSIKHFQDAYEEAAAKIKKQGDAEVLAKAAKEPAKVPAHLKGYDHIVNGSGTPSDKMQDVHTEYLKDVEKSATTEEMNKVFGNYTDAKNALKAQLASAKPAATPVAEKAPGHYTGTDGNLYYNAPSGKTFSTNSMTGLSTGEVKDPPPVDKMHGQVGLAKAMSEHVDHLNKVSPVTLPAEKPDLAKLGPTKYVHALADHMKGAEKKAVIAEAVKAGVNKSTAGVQYGKWAAKQAGTPPQLEKSPEPAALQAKQPDKMTNAELDKALDSYQGKISTPNPTASYAPTPYKHTENYNDHEGGKALTKKLGKNEVYTNKKQGKTFYKSGSGNIYEHTGTEAGKMNQLVYASGTNAEIHYDPSSKIVYSKKDGILTPIKFVKTPIFKNDQPYDPGSHVFKSDAWSHGANGIQDPSFEGYTVDQFNALKAVHKAAGVTYNDTSSAVKSYTSSGYHAINGELRKSKGAVVGDRAKAIDKLMENSSFKEDTIMWRGVGGGNNHGAKTWNGSPPPDELVDDGFTSVSFKPSVGKAFSDGKTLFRVKVPKGFPGLNVAIGSPGSGEAGLHGEAEVMLPRGTTYKAVARHAKANIGGSHDIVDLEPVLPQWWVEKHGQPKLG
jgi:hypothetical protein